MKKLLVIALLCTGCFAKSFEVTALPSEPGHYVLVQSKRGKQKVFDCKSAPDGQTWAPECREVKK